MGCVSFSQAYFPAALSIKKTSSARAAAVQKLETLARQFRIQGWTVALGASGTIKAARKCWWRWARRTDLLRRNASKCWSVSC